MFLIGKNMERVMTDGNVSVFPEGFLIYKKFHSLFLSETQLNKLQTQILASN